MSAATTNGKIVRFTRSNPCPACGSYPSARKGESCKGFFTGDPNIFYCTRIESPHEKPTSPVSWRHFVNDRPLPSSPRPKRKRTRAEIDRKKNAIEVRSDEARSETEYLADLAEVAAVEGDGNPDMARAAIEARERAEREAAIRELEEAAREYADEETEQTNGEDMANAPNVVVGDFWRARLELDKKKNIRAIAFNAALILQNHAEWKGVIERDAFRDVVRLTRDPSWPSDVAPSTSHVEWSDTDYVRLQIWFEKASDVSTTFSPKACEAAVALAAERNERHAVREYLASLAWDGRPRVDAIFHNYFGVAHGSVDDDRYTVAVARALMIGAVARVMCPGIQLDTIPILEGKQGTGKSTALRVLAGEWFSDTPMDLGTKDSYVALRGVWLYEFGELGKLKHGEVERIKAFTSAPTDKYRPPYGRRDVNVPRQVAFVGTTNDAQYLQDATGNRRFLPVKTTRIDLEALKRDRDQLWAEALHLFTQGEAWHLTGDLVRIANEQQEARRSPDGWEELISLWLSKRNDPNEAVRTSDVLVGLGVDIKDHDRARTMRVGGILQHQLGWSRRQIRVGNTRSWFYFPAEEA